MLEAQPDCKLDPNQCMVIMRIEDKHGIHKTKALCKLCKNGEFPFKEESNG